MLIRPDGRVEDRLGHAVRLRPRPRGRARRVLGADPAAMEDPSIDTWVDSIGSTTGLPSADVVPYLDDEVELGAPSVGRGAQGGARAAGGARGHAAGARGSPGRASPGARARPRAGAVAALTGSGRQGHRRTGAPLRAAHGHRHGHEAERHRLDRAGRPRRHTAGDAVGALAGRHGVDRARVEDDVLGVVRTLTERGAGDPRDGRCVPRRRSVDSTPDLPDMNPGDTA